MKSTSRRRARRPAAPAPLDLRALPWKRMLGFVVGFAIVGALVFHAIDVDELHARAAELNGFVAFLFLTLLPLVGFPASVLHVAAGFRFGIPLGLALVAASILLQLLASYALVHLFRDRFAHRLAALRERIPPGAHHSICVLAVLLPGAPFAAVNYVLPLIGVPLRTYLLCCLPLHFLRSTVTVSFGGESQHLTGTRLAVLLVYALLILGASLWTYRRVKDQLGGPSSAAGDQKQPA